MKSVDTGYRPPESLNPFKIGEYVVYVATFPTGDGCFGAVLFADRIDSDSGLPRPALNLRRLDKTFDSRAAAETFAVQFGISEIQLQRVLG